MRPAPAPWGWGGRGAGAGAGNGGAQGRQEERLAFQGHPRPEKDINSAQTPIQRLGWGVSGVPSGDAHPLGLYGDPLLGGGGNLVPKNY